MLIKGEWEFVRKIGKLGISQKQLSEVQEKLKEVEEQLKRGDKYEMIYRDLVKFNNSDNTNFVLPGEYRGYQGGVLRYLLKTLHEKYFGKPKKPSKSFSEGFKEGVELGLQFKALDMKFKDILGENYGTRTG